MLNRLLSGMLCAATLVNGIIHHLAGKALLALCLVFTGCLLLIWFPGELNEYTLGSWTRGAQIDVPTPAFLIAAFGWVVLLTTLIIINVGLHRSP